MGGYHIIEKVDHSTSISKGVLSKPETVTSGIWLSNTSIKPFGSTATPPESQKVKIPRKP